MRVPTHLKLNQIGGVSLRTSAPLLSEAYLLNRTTGGLNVVDASTNDTLGAGMILGELG